MMIRINLLPVRQVKKREAGRQFLVVVGGVTIMTLLGNGYWYQSMESEREKQERRLNDTKARIEQLQKVIGEVDNLNKRKKEVEDKLKVLDDLRKKRGGPVKLLDALATAIPKKVMITDFDEKSSAVKMLGQAESLDDVSEFMRALKSVVWTPKGMGRVVEVKRDGSSARVELIGINAIEDFQGPEIGYFFQGIELKTSAAETSKATRSVKFELALNVNYAI